MKYSHIIHVWYMLPTNLIFFFHDKVSVYFVRTPGPWMIWFHISTFPHPIPSLSCQHPRWVLRLVIVPLAAGSLASTAKWANPRGIDDKSIYGGFLKWWYPQIIRFNRVFHYKPSILGYPIFGNTHMCFFKCTPMWTHVCHLKRFFCLKLDGLSVQRAGWFILDWNPLVS